MKRFLAHIFIAAIVVLAVGPLVNSVSGTSLSWLDGTTVAALNFLGWSIVLTLFAWRTDLKRAVRDMATRIGVVRPRASLEALLDSLLHEFARRHESLSLNVLERRIASDEELSRALERVVSLAMALLDGESAELALFDRESGMYHSSFVVGKPFRASAQAMLSGAADREDSYVSPDVMIQPIAFAGSILGSLRVALKKGQLPTPGDKQIMAMLALQSGVAIVNAQFTQQLLRMRAASEESIRAKTGFLANLSHELRGPLGIMINAVELVLDGLCGPVSEEQGDTLQMIKSNGAHLLDLINDVLDYAKVESGKVQVQKVELVLNDLLKDVTATVRQEAEGKGHKLRYRAGEDVLAISCDRRHFRQILINLLTNAVKYTPEGGDIEVWAERSPGGKIKINVKDSGIGIEASEHDRVFEAFERVENSYSLNQVGTGLGLSLTKKLIEVNGGQIDFSSESGKGSHFWVVFPSVDPALVIDDDDETAVDHAQGKSDVLLLVQRDEGERGMLVRYLSHVGFVVLPAENDSEALVSLRDKNVRLVLIDNDIVDDPEYDVVGSIRESAKASALPVILISSRAFVFDIRKYLKAGIDRCLIKPLELRQLGHICRQLIDDSLKSGVDEEIQDEKGRPSLSTSKAHEDIIH